LREYLPDGTSILELGMGPGVDLDILSEVYQASGSDLSPLFLDRYSVRHPGTDLLLLDAINIETDRTFDAIYSNKVLHYLSKSKLVESLLRQHEMLNPGGL